MNIEDDPRLTAFALGELVDEECLIFKQDLENAGGGARALNEIRNCAVLVREAYDSEPKYVMTDEQRGVLLGDCELFPAAVPLTEEEIGISNKILPWVTQPVISEIKKQKIAAEIRPTRWQQAVPFLSSFGVAAGVIFLAVILLKNEPIKSKFKASSVGKEDGIMSITIVETESLNLTGKADWVRRQMGGSPLGSPLPYRYGEPSQAAKTQNIASSEGKDFRDPAIKGHRWSVFPSKVGVQSYEILRDFLLAGTIPQIGKVLVGELLNAFEYDYSFPAIGERFAVDAEVAECPWNPTRQLLHVGVRAAEVESVSGITGAVAEDVRMAVEFNPAMVAGYRLIGEINSEEGNRIKPSVQNVIGGQTVTALYEVVPKKNEKESVRNTSVPGSELVTVRVDYNDPADGGTHSVLASVDEAGKVSWKEASDDMRFAASVAGYGMLLSGAEDQPLATYDLVLELAREALGEDREGERSDFVDWVEKTKELKEKREKN